MSSIRKVVGFDRKLELSWLDATAAQLAAGASADELHAYLWKLLDGSVSAGSSGFNSDRGKTITVLKRIWCLVPEERAALRDRALEHLVTTAPEERVAIHWSLCVLAYPFFRDVAEAVGRLLSLQGGVQISDVRRRAAERWGERVITRNGSQRIVRCFVAWGLLGEGDRRGAYAPVPRTAVIDAAVVEILLEALLLGEETKSADMARLERHPVLFPFDIPALLSTARSCERFRIERSGVDGERVGLA